MSEQSFTPEPENIIPCGWPSKSKYLERPSCSHGQMSSTGAKWACKEKVREQTRKYRETHREQDLEKGRKYYEANREQILQRYRKYYEANREQILQRDSKYHETHREQILQRKRKYYEANRKRILEEKHKQWQNAVKTNTCVKCGKSSEGSGRVGYCIIHVIANDRTNRNWYDKKAFEEIDRQQQELDRRMERIKEKNDGDI